MSATIEQTYRRLVVIWQVNVVFCVALLGFDLVFGRWTLAAIAGAVMAFDLTGMTFAQVRYRLLREAKP